MDFRILGPLEVLDQGRRVSIRRGKDQALLAYLLLHANELIASDRLVDELWGERPPPTAAKILQNAVSQLRKALGDDRLVTRPPGYLLRLEPGELDLDRFEALAERGRAARDPRLLREALELWRGEPLADLRDEPFAQRASLQLEEARLAAHEDRIEADLADGRDAQLVPELEGLVDRHPFDERLYRQLMLALYRAGRPGNALEVYQRARKTFDEQLGLQPGPELEELQRKILNQDDELSASRRAAPLARVAAPLRRLRLMLVLAVALVGAAVVMGLLLWDNGSGAPAVIPNSLVKLDPNTGKVLDVIEVGRQPVALAVVGDAVWVSNNEDETVTRVDPRTGHTDTIGGLRPPLDLVADGTRYVWISTNEYEQVTRIDTRTLHKDIVVPLGRNTFLLGIGAGSLWVTERPPNLGDRGTVARINLETAKVERTFEVGPVPVDVKIGKGAAWVTNGADASVSRINLGDGSVERIPIGSGPGHLVIAFGSVWIIAGRENDTVWRLNPQTRQPDAVIKVGKWPFNVTADGRGLWVALRETGKIVRIDPRTNLVTRTVRLGYKPQGMAVGAGALWVTIGHGNLG
ncbi:MAG: winged helix-turn-helix domain-containing protein [Actinobacteria bacterium]|nr:winged helix-turn-helix domain-containing protein [Actinomycetota bacterium]